MKNSQFEDVLRNKAQSFQPPVPPEVLAGVKAAAGIGKVAAAKATIIKLATSAASKTIVAVATVSSGGYFAAEEVWPGFADELFSREETAKRELVEVRKTDSENQILIAEKPEQASAEQIAALDTNALVYGEFRDTKPENQAAVFEKEKAEIFSRSKKAAGKPTTKQQAEKQKLSSLLTAKVRSSSKIEQTTVKNAIAQVEPKQEKEPKKNENLFDKQKEGSILPKKNLTEAKILQKKANSSNSISEFPKEVTSGNGSLPPLSDNSVAITEVPDNENGVTLVATEEQEDEFTEPTEEQLKKRTEERVIAETISEEMRARLLKNTLALMALPAQSVSDELDSLKLSTAFQSNSEKVQRGISIHPFAMYSKLLSTEELSNKADSKQQRQGNAWGAGLAAYRLMSSRVRLGVLLDYQQNTLTTQYLSSQGQDGKITKRMNLISLKAGGQFGLFRTKRLSTQIAAHIGLGYKLKFSNEISGKYFEQSFTADLTSRGLWGLSSDFSLLLNYRIGKQLWLEGGLQGTAVQLDNTNWLLSYGGKVGFVYYW